MGDPTPESSWGLRRQIEIYLAGVAGKTPDQSVSVEELELKAKTCLKREAVGDQALLLFDSGIRRGADVFKAVALGARCVLLGRPYAFGLAVGGEQGVHDVLANLIADIDLTLGLAGRTSFAEVDQASLVASN